MSTNQEKLFELLDALCNGTMTPDEHRRLGEWLAEDSAARQFYFDYLDLHVMLRQWRQTAVDPKAEEKVERGEGRGERDTLTTGHWPLATSPSPQPLAPSPSLIPPSYPSHSPLSPLPSPLFSIDTPLGGFLVSYGSATVFVGILIFIFSLMNSPSQRGEKIVGQSATGYASAGAERPAPEETVPEIVSVANITGMVDCKWVDKSQAPAYYKIKLHDKFALTSGLMEITYHTGARVILQGPCTYEVDSADGGYLSLGKLTARVEKRGEGLAEAANLPSPFGRVARREGVVPSPDLSPITLALSQREREPDSSPLFAVRTPTAVVTDLGTEFGVEVDKLSRTRAHVFVGMVRLTSDSSSDRETGQMLKAGESAQVAAQGVVESIMPDTERKPFVRAMPKSQTKSSDIVVLAHFRLGEDDNGAADGQPAMKTTKDAMYSWQLERHGSPRYTADTAAPGSTLAMLFHGGGDEGDHYVGKTVVTDATDNFGIEAWVKPSGTNGVGAIVWNGDSGWGILQRGNILCGHVNGLGNVGAYPIAPGEWHHAALVCNAGRLTFYIDGRSWGSNLVRDSIAKAGVLATLTAPSGRFWIGCLHHTPGGKDDFLHFDGAVDEVRVFTFAKGQFQPKDLLYKGDGAKAGKRLGDGAIW